MNLLETAANEGLVEAQYDMGYYYFLFWAQKPDNTALFSNSNKWLRKAMRSGNSASYNLLGQLYYEYGKYTDDLNFLKQAQMLLETVPAVGEVNDKDDNVLDAQALLGSVMLGQWRMSGDTLALKDAKKWYRMLLRSDKEYPNYSKYIDSLAVVLSQGIPMSIDPKVEQTEEQQTQTQSGRGGRGGFPMMGGGAGGFGGGMNGGQGRPGNGGQNAFQGVPAQYPGGMFNMMQYIRSNTNYPKECEDARIKGTAVVSFSVDTDGSIVDPVVTNEINHLLGREALRTVMLMPDWVPATQDGKPVKYQTQATVSFGGAQGGMGGMMMF